MEPVIQVALDFLELDRALQVAREAIEGGADWIEAGTPLIKSEGLDAIRALRKEFPGRTIVADMKTMDAGRAEVEAAAKAGATVVTVLGRAADSTISEAVEAGWHYGARVCCDLIGFSADEVAGAARRAEKIGAAFVNVHAPIDEQMLGLDPFDRLRRVVGTVEIPVSVAGGLNSENVVRALEIGASILVVGGAIIKAKDPRGAAAAIKEAISTCRAVPTELFKRGGAEQIREILARVSTPNVSDAAHRGAAMWGIRPICQGLRAIGTAVTVRTYPGDWAKPVEAIDAAEPGQVLVIDACGREPAVWGELATLSAIQRKLAGVVVDGAVRDTPEIRRMGFPAFSRLVCPNAGEPKGFGEINVPVIVGGQKVGPGDWILGDDDGVVVLPKEKAVELVNRAQDVLEKENRLREEIRQGGTLSKVAQLLRWEKHG
ncbi:MAG: orotidine 5'-phosphate decarboxylase [Planctomycetota bacterium]|nr:orotidine 5'-phosphate decarboxylase [Planctomycetota bacterium]